MEEKKPFEEVPVSNYPPASSHELFWWPWSAPHPRFSSTQWWSLRLSRQAQWLGWVAIHPRCHRPLPQHLPIWSLSYHPCSLPKNTPSSLLTTLKAQTNQKKGSIKKTPKEKKHTETSRRSTAISLTTEEANDRRHKSTRMRRRRRRRERETQQRHKKQYPGTPICTLPRSGGNPNPGHPLLQRSNGIARMGPYA